MNSSISFIVPEIILCTGATALLIAGAIGSRRRLLNIIAVMTVAISFFSMFAVPGNIHSVFSGMLINDAFSYVLRVFVLVVAMLSVLMSIGYTWPQEEDAGEYYFFILLATVSMMFAVSAGNMIMIYLSIEALSIISYILACYFKKDVLSTEAGVKYFLFGTLSTGLMLYGISLVYGLTGTLDLEKILIQLKVLEGYAPVLGLAAILIFAGFAFKASIVPFHVWVADVYNGAPWPVAAFFSIGPKAVGFALLIKVFFGYSLFLSSIWTGIAVILAVATMFVGNLSAFHQDNVKRLLAFSSVAQAGYIFAGLAMGLSGLKAAFFYIIIYTFMNMGAFACVSYLASDLSDIKALRGISRTSPAGAFILSVFLLSLAGLPPLAGFWAKFFILCSIIDARHYFLAGILVFNSCVAFFYYLKIVRTMYFDEPLSTVVSRKTSYSTLIVLASCCLMVIEAGIFPRILLDFLGLLFH